jgi:hypothetical protein
MIRLLVVVSAILLALGILKVPYLGAAPARALDIPYKSALILGGTVEGGSFSWTSSDLCNEPFCARIGTRNMVVWGRPGYSSQHKWSFCELHTSSQWTTGSRLDGPLFLLPYWFLVYGAYFILGLALIPLALRILALPVLIPAILFKRQPWHVLLPWKESDTPSWAQGLDAFSLAIMVVVLGATAIAYWWF